MELEQIRQKWQTVKTPSYSKDELESIFHLRQKSVLFSIKSGLKIDLIIAELIVVAFIILLQYLNLGTSNFWSVIMAFIGLQHFISYTLQNYLIQRMSGFTGDVQNSLDSSLSKLTALLWWYRIIPAVLSVALYSLYLLSFGIPFSGTIILAAGIGILMTTILISEFLSSVLLKKQISHLKRLKTDFLDSDLSG